MMKAVVCDVPQILLDPQRQTGSGRWNEMWNGDLYIPPLPSRQHQDFCSDLAAWLRDRRVRPHGNRVHREVNLASIGGWPSNYRIPGLLLTPDRFEIDHDANFEGPPLVVVEIHSPGDEAYDKLNIYSELGVPAVWIIDRDSRKPQLFSLQRDAYVETTADAEGWFVSRATGVRLKRGRSRKLLLLLLQYRNAAESRTTLPEPR